jgi:hypothetical protein
MTATVIHDTKFIENKGILVRKSQRRLKVGGADDTKKNFLCANISAFRYDGSKFVIQASIKL